MTTSKKHLPDVSVQQVKSFWEEHPLLAYEIPYEPGSQEFFDAYDRIRQTVEFKYCFHLLRLSPEWKGRVILDVGCGNGWLLLQYAKYGLTAYGIDLTMRGVQISMERFKRHHMQGTFINASAEEIPFRDNSFDMVTSLGVIHHTPKTEQCARELIRVCRPGGRLLIAVYYDNLLTKKWFYPITRFALSYLGRKPLARLDRQSFINRYDGFDNPLGKAYSKQQACNLLRGLNNIKYEVHYFPKRFVPAIDKFSMPACLDRVFDRMFGFLIYVEGYKPLL